VPLFETATDLDQQGEVLRRRPYGVIEVAEGRLCRVVLRPFPAMASLAGSRLIGGWRHRCQSGDRVWLYYNQPRRCPNFLVLKYAESARNTSFASITRALAVLDEIARLKGSDALLCDAANGRITARQLGRWGWQPHCPARFHRHFIKRFYGVYP
jgi:hypothetical protein